MGNGVLEKRVLLVEDDFSLAMGLEFSLKDEGYEVIVADRAEKCRLQLQNNSFNLIILDVTLPDGNGYELCREIRGYSEVPIIFLTALYEEVNIILGLEIGGDDYITKPFRVKELLSRVKALIRRSEKSSTKDEVILKSLEIEVNKDRAEVLKGKNKIVLTASEYKLLMIFLNKSRKVLSREEILSELTEGEGAYFDENTLSVYIKRMREKIEDNPKEPVYIKTIRGLGYIWDAEVKNIT